MNKNPFLIVISSIIALVILGFSMYMFQWWFAEPKGKLEMRKEVQSGEHRRYSYNHFFDLCTAARTKAQMYQNIKNRIENETNPSSHLKNKKMAIMAEYRNVIEKYNQDARKAKTIGQFRAEELPSRLELKEEGLPRCK